MDDNNDRSMKDRHCRDEAQVRRLQQEAAGKGYTPVEAYPQHGAQPLFLRPVDTLMRDYESTLALERFAWEAVKVSSQEQQFELAWQEWRTAVEVRDRATRLVINRSMSGQ